MTRRSRTLLISFYVVAFSLVNVTFVKAQAPIPIPAPTQELEKQDKDKDKPDAPVAADSVTKSPLERQPYEPISGKNRLQWFLVRSAGPESLIAGLFTAGIGTARNKPEEYEAHFDGFAKRYGMRFTGVATGNAMEASLGAIWGEDPRYFRAEGQPFGKRVVHVMVMTFVARRHDGHYEPAYARYISTAGNNFLSNTWRADSEATTNAALTRTALGFLGRMADNTYQEFWPSVKKHVMRGPLKNAPIVNSL